MSTATLGGIPTTTKHAVSFTSNYVNATEYVCPADTICYLNMININIQASSGVVSGVIRFYINQGTNTDIYNQTFLTLAVQVISFDTFGIINLKDFYNRLNNPTVIPGSTPTTPTIGGQIILFPSDTLGVSLTTTSGTFSGIFEFGTTEVTSAT